METKILEAIEEMDGHVYNTLDEAIQNYSKRELLDIWLKYEGIIGYTDMILSVMITIGFDLDIPDSDFFEI